MEQEVLQIANTWRGLPLTITSCLPSARLPSPFYRDPVPRGADRNKPLPFGANVNTPAVCLKLTEHQFRSVVLPHPFGPIRAILSPRRPGQKNLSPVAYRQPGSKRPPFENDLTGAAGFFHLHLCGTLTSRRSPRSRRIAFRARTRPHYGYDVL